jgi:H2-forming N5,N10-methylenetetrahydromethanopterin dehydrogenase-like enzyme
MPEQTQLESRREMHIEDREHLNRIDIKLDSQSEMLSEIRIAIARLETQPICKTPNLCSALQTLITDHEKRLARLEAVHSWTLGVFASVSFLAFLSWDGFKLWIKK